ncbi:hypothetical protein LA080_012981 [Diaporthe eres]|nr:hypothetical protein LA080_012981 [Diaporthe eres]
MPRPQFKMIPETTVAYKTQLATSNQGPVVLFNMFIVPPEKLEAFMEYWHGDATHMKAHEKFQTGLGRCPEGIIAYPLLL